MTPYSRSGATQQPNGIGHLPEQNELCNDAILKRFGQWESYDLYPSYMSPLGWGLGISLCAIVVIAVALMLPRRHLYPLCLSSPVLATAQGVGILFLCVVVCFRDANLRRDFSCDVTLWGKTLSFPLIIGSQIAMLSQMHNRVLLAEEMQKFSVTEDDIAFDELIRSVRRAGRWNEVRVILIIMIVPLAVAIAAYHKDYYGNGCIGCQRELEGDLIFACFAFLGLGASVILVYCLRRYEDPLRLRQKCQRVLLVFIFATISFIILSNLDPGHYEDHGYVNYSWIIVAGAMYAFTANCLWPLFLTFYDPLQAKLYRRRHRQHHCKMARRFQVVDRLRTNAITSLAASSGLKSNANSTVPSEQDDLSLGEVLQVRNGLQAFQRHLAQEFNIENILFWRAAQEWRDMYYRSPTIQSREIVAQKIYAAFIPHRAPMQVNLSCHHVQSLAAIFETRDSCNCSPKPITVFDEAISAVFQLMQSDSFQRFKFTDAYLNLNSRRHSVVSRSRKISLTTKSASHQQGYCRRNEHLEIEQEQGYDANNPQQRAQMPCPRNPVEPQQDTDYPHEDEDNRTTIIGGQTGKPRMSIV